MKSTTYKKDSWHYRINTSENMLVPLITQRYDWDENDHYCKQPPKESCTYWQNVLLYILLQIPMMFIVGLAIIFVGVWLPLFSLVAFISTGMILDGVGVGLGLLVLYTLTFIIAIVYVKIQNTEPQFVNDITEMYDSLKEKYCKKLEFK